MDVDKEDEQQLLINPETVMQTHLELQELLNFMKEIPQIAISSEKIIQEIGDRIEHVLISLSTNEMLGNEKKAVLELLDMIFHVNFPVTSIVNHVLAVVFHHNRDIADEFFRDMTIPNNTVKLNYFLKHAHDRKNGLSFKGFRLSDFLVADFFRTDCPRALLTILSYGCSDLLRKKTFEIDRHKWRKIGDSVISEYQLLETLQFLLYVSSNDRQLDLEEYQHKVDCLKIICRSTFSFSFEQLYRLSDFSDDDNYLDGFKTFGMQFLFGTCRFPELDERLGKTAPSLKHMCRFEIRKNLYKNWSLPEGIKLLGLPFALEEYVNLKTD